MSQSPLARSTRRTLPAFARTPSALSKSTTAPNLSDVVNGHDDGENDDEENGKSHRSSPRASTSAIQKHKTPSRLAQRSSLGGSALGSAPNSATRTPQYASTGTSTHGGNTPRTPIHYSPFATTTPPAGLSKSASTPFNMAESARMARKVEEENRRKSMGLGVEGDTPLGVPAKKKRLIRKKPILQRITDIPQNLIDRFLLFSPSSFEDLLPPAHLANPIALGIHMLHFLLIAPMMQSKDEIASILRTGKGPVGAGGRWSRWEDEQRVARRGLLSGWTVFIITGALLLLASANSIYLFTRFRTYDMQLRSAHESVPSPHASPVKAPQPDVDDPFAAPTTPTSSKSTQALRLFGRYTWLLIKWIYRATLSAIGHPLPRQTPNQSPSGNTIQCLRVWDPQDFSLSFFCALPPSAPLLTHLLTPLHPLLTPILHLTMSLLLSHLATSYAQLVKDRMILSAEVMREYDKRFVYKRIFGGKVDRGVQTNEAETIW